MLSLRKPSNETIRRFLSAQSALAFSYQEVGATATELPTSYVVDHTRVKLGEGVGVFDAACGELQNWQQFHLGWLEAWPNDTPIREGEAVVVLARAFGFWWLNASRIVYVVDKQTDSLARFGFAYGTLPGHVEAGEERFLIEWDRADDSVWYDILAFSRPRHFLSRVGKRQVRWMQKRFGLDSTAVMMQAVENTKW